MKELSSGESETEGNRDIDQTPRPGLPMVIILDGNSGMGSHVRSNYLLFDLFKAFD